MRTAGKRWGEAVGAGRWVVTPADRSTGLQAVTASIRGAITHPSSL
jgi:hypothetical protein